MFRKKHSRSLLTVALAGLPLSALAQSITTLPPNTGHGGVFLQLTPTTSTLRVESFSTYFGYDAGAPVTVEVWTRPGAYAGFTGNSNGWVLSETVTGTSAGRFQLAGTILLTKPITVPTGGPTSIYLHCNTGFYGLSYRDQSTTITNADVTLFSDTVRYSAFFPAVAFGGSQITPLSFAGTINYVIGGITGRCCRTDGSCVVTSATHCAATGGVYGGNGTTCTPNGCTQPPTGRCCFELGTCSVLSAANCAALGGTYAGNGTACGTCPKPGACCLPDGSCVILTSAKCTSVTTGGIYRGNGTLCGTVFPRCWSAPTLWENGPTSTGATTQNGEAAPAGRTWSETSNDAGENTVANGTGAWYVQTLTSSGAFRIADNFTISNLNGWHIDKVIIPTLQYPPTTYSTVGSATLQIWSGPPGVAGSVVVWGDTTTNRLGATSMANIDRRKNTIVPPICGGAPFTPESTDTVVNAELSINTNLPVGTYWLDWSVQGIPGTSVCSALPVTIKGLRQPTLHADSRQGQPNGWVAVVDTGMGCGPESKAQDFPFEVRGFVWCYANCDHSTGAPVLTSNDFQCFLNRFAAGEAYANCDGSTGNPALTSNDFQCFLNKFAAGCS